LRPEGSLDPVRHPARELSTGVSTELELLTVEVDDVEDEDVLQAVAIRPLRDVQLGRRGDGPDVLRPPARNVVAAEPAGGRLEPHGAEAPQRRARGGERARSAQRLQNAQGAHGRGRITLLFPHPKMSGVDPAPL